ncbi:hypothetical protein J27TS7_16360 [Paenibacillus dendritiformis]|uniref:DNA primase family protein n=1 Tax=Paenibacillus dendritiformis TaxID=130049 RepID=UPI001B114941|nr:phage/plasmid primase, P4 family [Paenibacillus dendritiformis]GIO72122.1 hypothetical protein J27TS7_16360 [Paenibacillus dendritiformis]
MAASYQTLEVMKSCLSPIVEQLDERLALKERGITYGKKDLEMNVNIFVSYVLSRMHLVQLNGQIYSYCNKGYYIEMNRNILLTICRGIVLEAHSTGWLPKWESEYYKALIREIPYVDAMNPDKGFINLANGMLNLYTMDFVDHDPRFLSTIQIPIEYNKTASCPKFEEFLFDIFEGDEERIKLVQEIMGYCFIPDIKIQKAFFFIGSGSNGKSVLSEIIRYLIGIENVSNVSLKDLGGRFGMQNLPEKLVNVSTENEFDRKFNTQNFKILTGGDAVNVEQKFKASFNTRLFAKTIVLLNSMMDSNDLTNGYFRRLQIIPFNKIYRELRAGEAPIEGVSYMDKSLLDKLLTELPGILNFAMKGLARLIDNNFNLTESKVCEKALEDYKVSQNPLPEYFKARVFWAGGEQTLRSDFKRDFSRWADNNGLDNVKSIGSTKFWEMFSRVLIEQGIKVREKKINGDYYVEGLGINY